jgi:hypothetical protein
MGQDDRIDLSRISPLLKVGECARPGVEEDGGVVGLDQIPAPRTIGAGPAPIAPQNGE